MPKPQWHAPWKLYRVISGHLGWVRCIDVDPSNEWFVTGSGDRIIKVKYKMLIHANHAYWYYVI
jgi:pleiotropic regulator 1